MPVHAISAILELPVGAHKMYLSISVISLSMLPGEEAVAQPMGIPAAETLSRKP